MSTQRLAFVALAVGLCLANVAKPLTVDDTVYVEFARQIAAHPTDPYGFTAGPHNQPALEVLAPPVLLYWLGGSLALFGEREWCWKLSLLPFCLLLVGGLASLARRLCPGRELAVTACVVLSPAVLPCLNLMLDLPALALGLVALAVLLASWDGPSGGGRVVGLRGILLAGALAGLAMQTKYTAAVFPALFVVAGFLWRRPLAGVAAALLAVTLFVGWEGLLLARYGQSHFVYALRSREGALGEKARLVLPLIGLLGGTASAGALLALIGLGGRWRGALVLCAAVASAYLALAVVPEAQATLVAGERTGRSYLTVNGLAFGGLGVVVMAVGVAACVQLARMPGGRRESYLLLAWTGLEVAAYFVLSPYQAVRRVLGLVVVGVFVGGRLCVPGRNGLGGRDDRPCPAWPAVVLAAATGLVGFVVDGDLYLRERQGAWAVADELRREAPRGSSATWWFCGVGPFEFYAARHGLRRLDLPGTEPAPGDLLVAFGVRAGAPVEAGPPPGWEWVRSVRIDTPLPLRSRYQYGGSALERQQGEAARLDIYRARGG